MPPVAAPQVQDPSRLRRREGPEPLRRRRVAPPPSPPSSWKRRSLNIILGFATIVLVVDALVGERGLLEMIRARRQWRAAAAGLSQLRQENTSLREEARRLKDDPAAIESLAREELGLIRPDEYLFIVKEPRPVKHQAPAGEMRRQAQ